MEVLEERNIISVSRRCFKKTDKEKQKLPLTRHASITRAKQQNIKKLENVSKKSPPVGTSKRDRGKYFANVTENVYRTKGERKAPGKKERKVGSWKKRSGRKVRGTRAQ